MTRHRAAFARLAVIAPCLVLAPMARATGAQGLPPVTSSPPARQIVTNPLAPPSRQGLELTLSGSEAYERNDLGGLQASTSASIPIYQKSGFFGNATAGLGFNISRQRGLATFSANANGDANAHTSSGRVLVTAGSGLNASLPIGRRTTIDGSGTFGYAPYYGFGLFPALGALGSTVGNAVLDPNINFAIRPTRILQLGTRVGLSHQLSMRSSIGAHFGESHTYFEGDQPTQQGRDVGGQYSHVLTRSMTVRVGYTLQAGATSLAGVRPMTHNIDAGVNYSKALSFARKTTVGFSTGSALLSDGTGSGLVIDRTHFRLTGSAHLDHQIGRSWSAQAVYNRGFEFVDMFVAPAFVDSVTFGVGGALNRRTTVGTDVSYLHGAFGGLTSDQQDAWSASSMVRIQMARTFSFFAQYHYYWYEFTNVSQLPGGLPQALKRDGAQVGLTLSVPLF